MTLPRRFVSALVAILILGSPWLAPRLATAEPVAVRTFSDVQVGRGRFYIDSRGRLSLGLNQRDFAQTYKVEEGAALFIPRKPKG